MKQSKERQIEKLKSEFIENSKRLNMAVIMKDVALIRIYTKRDKILRNYLRELGVLRGN